MEKRKRRSDRNHQIYVILNRETGEEYIGITQGSTKKDLEVRIKQHIYRAYIQKSDWKLYQNIREYGLASFDFLKLTTIRGKKEVHLFERALIEIFNPALNSQ